MKLYCVTNIGMTLELPLLIVAFDFHPQLSAIITVANCFVDLIDVQGSSVLVCFEDGWDATPQVSN